MIDRVKIGDIEYTVRLERDGEYDGSVTHSIAIIQIAPDMHPIVERCSLWHEIFHAIFKQTGQEDARQNEGLIEALSHSVVAIIRNNPELVEYTCGGHDVQVGNG